MRWIGGLLAFAVTVSLGNFGAWAGASAQPYLVFPEIEVSPSASVDYGHVPVPEGVQVLYAGHRWGAKGKRLTFFFLNGTNEPLIYIGYFPDSPFPTLTSNGGVLPSAHDCINGFREFTILPGRWAEVYVDENEFLTRPARKARISVGFQLRFASATESVLYYSESFCLPEDFRKFIEPR